MKKQNQKIFSIRAGLFWLGLIILGSSRALAGAVEVSVAEKKGRPIEGVVVILRNLNGEPAAPKPISVSITQIDQEFRPVISVIPVGSTVSFPNQDNILHHVYSFSEAKTFDLPLYKGVPNEPVQFDVPGVVALGCNIHDWMSAHVMVVDTPYYRQTDTDGIARIADLEAGEYQLELWHPRQSKAHFETFTVGVQALKKSAILRLKPSFRTNRRQSANDEQY